VSTFIFTFFSRCSFRGQEKSQESLGDTLRIGPITCTKCSAMVATSSVGSSLQRPRSCAKASTTPKAPRNSQASWPASTERALFLGFGVFEAGCKTVVGRRLKQSGAGKILIPCGLVLGQNFHGAWKERQTIHAKHELKARCWKNSNLKMVAWPSRPCRDWSTRSQPTYRNQGAPRRTRAGRLCLSRKIQKQGDLGMNHRVPRVAWMEKTEFLRTSGAPRPTGWTFQKVIIYIARVLALDVDWLSNHVPSHF
jgi:hypothetical protein